MKTITLSLALLLAACAYPMKAPTSKGGYSLEHMSPPATAQADPTEDKGRPQ